MRCRRLRSQCAQCGGRRAQAAASAEAVAAMAQQRRRNDCGGGAKNTRQPPRARLRQLSTKHRPARRLRRCGGTWRRQHGHAQACARQGTAAREGTEKKVCASKGRAAAALAAGIATYNTVRTCWSRVRAAAAAAAPTPAARRRQHNRGGATAAAAAASYQQRSTRRRCPPRRRRGPGCAAAARQAPPRARPLPCAHARRTKQNAQRRTQRWLQLFRRLDAAVTRALLALSARKRQRAEEREGSCAR